MEEGPLREGQSPKTLFEGHCAAGSVEPKAHICKVGVVIPVMESGTVGRMEWGLPWVSTAQSWGFSGGILPLRVGYLCPLGGLQVSSSVLAPTR